MFGEFKESTDVADISREDRPQISQEAQLKFESLFQDTKAIIFDGTLDEGEAQAESNEEYDMDGTVYKTDDMGNIYRKDGELLPDSEYTVNGNTYRTDENGNIDSCDATPRLCEDGKRNTADQREAGAQDRKEGDQGGHIVARILGGSEGMENLVPMRGTINQGDYKKMECEIKRALEEGKTVHLRVELERDPPSSRPTKIMAAYTIEGRNTEVAFDNEENSTELVGTLEGKLSADDMAQLREELQDMAKDNHPPAVTSVKTAFDEKGNAREVVVGVLDEATGVKSYKVFDVC